MSGQTGIRRQSFSQGCAALLCLGAPCPGTDSSKEGSTSFRLGVVLAVEVVAVGEQGVFGGVDGGGDDVGVGDG